ncbi:hypothetical protein R1sor_000459 [Riccia sorocarpa]|uniref:Uncharacterized protein n=1 Tax=Riccia sorocarpa TaxID=122646 RepID=A0ABD3GVJ6_9MARC
MTKSLGPLKRKVSSSLAKQTLYDKRSGESDSTELDKDYSSQADDKSLDSGKIFGSSPRPQGVVISTSRSVAAVMPGVSGSCSPRTPSPFSLSGKREAAEPQSSRQPKAQRSTRLRQPKRKVRFSDDASQRREDELKDCLASSSKLLSSNNTLFLEIPLAASLHNVELWETTSTSIPQMILVKICEAQPPSPNNGLPLPRASLSRFQSKLVPSASSHSPGISEPAMSIILRLLQEPRSRNSANRDFPSEKYMTAGWCEEVSSVCDETSSCVLDSGDQSTPHLVFESQVLEFQQIWSSKTLQMAEVAACMLMHNDFHFLPLVL